MRRKFHDIFFVLFYVWLAFASPVYAQGDENAVEAIPTFEEELLGLKQALTEKEKQKKVLFRDISREQDPVTKKQLEQELASIEDVISGLRDQIVTLSTGGAALFDEPPVVKREFDWRKDLELIFEPFLDQLRELSERPRAVEKLQSDIEFWKKREIELSKAAKTLQSNLDKVENAEARKELKSLLGTAMSRADTAKQKLSLLKNELENIQKQESPIWTTLGDIFLNIIFKIVLNFFSAIFAAFFVYQAIRLISLIFIKIIVNKNPEKTVFAERAIVVGRVVLGVLLALITYFVVLYSFSEWLLLVLSFLIIVGLVLALKHTLPSYFVEIKTMLNMGSIRQGERIMLNGLPWKIARLNVHTRLHNPALHGHLRVPLSEIVSCSSRPYHDDEPWFPTQVGDVIFLEDEVYGKVIRQTPDIVEVDLGGSIYTYQIADFLSRRPRNLSREGFTVYEIFGFDYQHQNEITGTILSTYKAAIEAAISGSEYAEDNTYLSIEFDNASASSLDFKVIASFSGGQAASYFNIKRLIQKASVEVANKEGWVIPFQQITVHHQPAK